MNFPKSAGKPPAPPRARIVRVAELDSSGNEVSHKYCVVEGANPMRVLFECATYELAQKWIATNGYQYGA